MPRAIRERREGPGPGRGVDTRSGSLLAWIRDRLRRRWFLLRVSLGGRRGPLLTLLKLRRKYDGKLVGSKTDLVVEGFPRSANTFCVISMSSGQRRPPCIASHTHIPAQVIRGVKLSIPVLVLLRKPEDAVISLVLRNRYLDLSVPLRYYAEFYRKIYPYRGKFLVASFEQVTSDLHAVIERLNRKFGSSFSLPLSTPEDTEAVLASIEERERRRGLDALALARPTEAKDDAKKAILSELRRSADLQPLLKRASHWHSRFLGLAGE